MSGRPTISTCAHGESNEPPVNSSCLLPLPLPAWQVPAPGSISPEFLVNWDDDDVSSMVGILKVVYHPGEVRPSRAAGQQGRRSGQEGRAGGQGRAVVFSWGLGCLPFSLYTRAPDL